MTCAACAQRMELDPQSFSLQAGGASPGALPSAMERLMSVHWSPDNGPNMGKQWMTLTKFCLRFTNNPCIT